jgi:hypothetical protein
VGTEIGRLQCFATVKQPPNRRIIRHVSKWSLTTSKAMSKLKESEVPMKRQWMVAASMAIALGVSTTQAQTVIGAKSGVVNWVEGDVFLADQPYVQQVSHVGEVKENQVLRTEEGRAEVLLPPGVFFRVGEKSSFKMISNRLIDTRVELLTGSAVMEIDDIDKTGSVTLIAKNATITLSKAGLYRFDVEPAQLKVFKGSADVEMAGQTVTVQAGKMLPLGGAVAIAEKFNATDTDSLDRWSRRRAEVVANANASAAKQAQYGSMGSSDPCYSATTGGYGNGPYGNGPYRTGPYGRPALGTWGYNPWYGFGTYIPCNGRIYSPYGYAMWSPMAAWRQFYAPRPVYNPSMGGGADSIFNRAPSYSTMGSSSGGYSGTTSAPMSSAPASAPAAASSGSSTAASAGASSAGHGSAASGGHGK